MVEAERESRPGSVRTRAIIVLLKKDHQLILLGEGQRPKEHAVNDAEDGGVGADAESESEDGDDGEAGAFDEEAEGEADVLEQSEHGFSRGGSRRESTSSFRRMVSAIVISAGRGPSRLPSYLRASRVNKPLPYKRCVGGGDCVR